MNCMWLMLVYFIDSKKDDHSPSWVNVIERLGPILPTFDLQQMFDGDHLLCIYISMIYRLKSLHDSGEKITYLQNIGKMLENFKSSWVELKYQLISIFVPFIAFIYSFRLNTESKLVIIWGLLITQGFKLLEFNSNAREPLLTLARHLKSTSNQSDGWGEGLLGAIGLKKDTVSNKYSCLQQDNNWIFCIYVCSYHFRRKIIAKCLACIIFSLFLDRFQTIHFHLCSLNKLN